MDELFLYKVCIVLLGLLLGSFYNVCIHRYIEGSSVVFPPSHCPKCQKRLVWWELIPLISYMMLRGKCSGCKEHISFRYPLVETISLVWTLLIVCRFGVGIETFIYLIFGGMLLVISFIDFELFIVPDCISLPGIALGIMASALLADRAVVDALIGAVAGGGVFVVIIYVYKWIRGIDGMGLGDVKLLAMIGAFLGWQALPLVILASSVFALFGAIFYVLKSPDHGSIGQLPIPFGPFLSLGAMFTLLYGDAVQQWILRI